MSNNQEMEQKINNYVKSEIELKFALRWAWPFTGALCFLIAAGIKNESMNNPAEPSEIQPAIESYAHIKENGGSTTDLLTMYNGLHAARSTKSNISNALENIIIAEIKEEKINPQHIDTQQFLANQIYTELNRYTWKDNKNVDIASFILAAVGTGLCGLGYYFHRSGKKDQWYLERVTTHKKESDEEYTH